MATLNENVNENINENETKKNELIKLLNKIEYTYDVPKNDILDKLINLFKNNIIDEECTDDDYITYKAYFYYKILKDHKSAKKFYKEAMMMENTHAMHGLAMYYKRYDRPNKMLKYLKMAIKKNDNVAMIDYGNHHLFENNNINKAMKYYNMAKKNNHYRGYYELAYYFYEYKFNYQKCKENMLLFLNTIDSDAEAYLDDLKLRGVLFEKLITLILVHEYEEDISFLKPYCDKLGININDTYNLYKIKMQSKKQFQTNREKIFLKDEECGVCYETKELYLFDCIGHYICASCYLKVDKCPFCSINKHPLMLKNKNIKIDIPVNDITEEATSDLISDYESNSEKSDDEMYNLEDGLFGTYIPSSDDDEDNEDEDEEEDEEDEENENQENENENNINENHVVINENEEHHLDGGHVYTPPNEREE